MKIFKRILLTLVILIAIPLIIALFTSDSFVAEREIEINRPKQEVFDYIRMLKNQDNFSVWAKKDPNMKKSYSGTDGEVGFISKWDSKNEDVGKGEQEIMKISEGKRIDTKLRFKLPFEAEDDAYFLTNAAGEHKTILKWGFSGKKNYIMRVMCLFVNMEEMIGKDFETGLDGLKKILEKGEK